MPPVPRSTRTGGTRHRFDRAQPTHNPWKGIQLLAANERSTTPDPSVTIKGLDQLLSVWEANRAHRLKAKVAKATIADQLRGLFGGGQ